MAGATHLVHQDTPPPSGPPALSWEVRPALASPALHPRAGEPAPVIPTLRLMKLLLLDAENPQGGGHTASPATPHQDTPDTYMEAETDMPVTGSDASTESQGHTFMGSSRSDTHTGSHTCPSSQMLTRILNQLTPSHPLSGVNSPPSPHPHQHTHTHMLTSSHTQHTSSHVHPACTHRRCTPAHTLSHSKNKPKTNDTHTYIHTQFGSHTCSPIHPSSRTHTPRATNGLWFTLFHPPAGTEMHAHWFTHTNTAAAQAHDSEHYPPRPSAV